MGATKKKKPASSQVPTVAEAKARLMSQAAIDMADLAVLIGVHPATAQRSANRGDLPVRTARVGQRWIVPSAPVKELLGLNADGAA
jgi:hypothetical protein